MIKKILIYLFMLINASMSEASHLIQSHAFRENFTGTTLSGNTVNVTLAGISKLASMHTEVSGDEIDSDEYDDINTAVADCGNRTLILSTAETLTGDLSIPADCMLEVKNGGSISKASTYTFTHNGGLKAPIKQFLIGFNTSEDITYGDKIPIIYPEWAGATGSGSPTDDLNAMVLTFEQTGKTIILGGPSKDYYVTASLPLGAGSIVLCNDSTITMHLATDERGILPKSNSAIKNCTINVTTDGGSSSGSGDMQAPVTVGNYISGVGYNNITFENLTLNTERAGGIGINIMSDSHNITTDNITCPASTTLGTCIQVHWGGTGALAAPTCNANSTTHPYNIRLNNTFGYNHSNDGANDGIIWISGAYNVDVNGVNGFKVHRVITVFAGDYANAYARTDTQHELVGYGIKLRNVTAREVTEKGIRIDGASFQIGESLHCAGSRTILEMPVEMEDIQLTGSSTSDSGIDLNNIRGVQIKNPTISGFQIGVTSKDTAYDVKIVGGDISDRLPKHILFQRFSEVTGHR